ncbi:hypothetical protein L3X38_009056 [Prunus dulcis]|uniref:GATA-type domain-containing protein n=1 Tax=Prunus dulcis TaxID=3755 RepID=A0AAD5F7F5_PRUDU|nr:hypothetical protein L3X38_009056 [Prunus dulcis]
MDRMEKPVLCNACGSRYRMRGTLENYTPKHVHYLQRNRSRPNNVHHVAVPTENNLTIEDDVIDLTNVEDDDGSSSKHNADIENQIQEEYAGDDAEPHIFKSHIPSKKRSEVPISAIESLRRDLLNVLNSVEFSNPSESAEDVLIYNNANNHPSISVHEIGLGAILLKPPTSPAEETSETVDKAPDEEAATRNSSSDKETVNK